MDNGWEKQMKTGSMPNLAREHTEYYLGIQEKGLFYNRSQEHGTPVQRLPYA